VKKLEGKRPLGRPGRRWEDVLNGEDLSHLPEDRDKLWVQVNTPMQFRVAWNCGECLCQLINDYLVPEAIRPVGVSQSVCHCKQLPPPSVHITRTEAILKPCITVHKHPNVTLYRIIITCHKCRCSQRTLLPKWGVNNKVLGRTERTGLFTAVRYAQLPSSNYTSPPSLFVSFPQLNLHVHRTAVQHWAKQPKTFQTFLQFPPPPKKGNQTEMFIEHKKYYAHKNKGLWVKIWGRVHQKEGGGGGEEDR